METNSIGTLTGTADTKKKKDAAPGDADAFAQAMGQVSEAESEGEKKAQLIAKDDSNKDKAAKPDSDKKQEVAGKDDKGKGVKGRHAKGSIGDYLENIASKDPATLSMAERATFQLGEFAKKGTGGMSGMAQMLASQGIDMSSFSPQQIMSLLSRMDTKELGKMMSQMKMTGGTFDEDSLKKLQEQLNANNQAHKNTQQPGNFNLESFMAAGMPKEAGEAARQEQRRMVMDQILSNIQVRNVANQTEMQLRLNPEYLGEVKITLVHDDDGGVKAKFSTTSKVTSEVLAESKNELMEQAAGKGVRIGSMDVEYVDSLSA